MKPSEGASVDAIESQLNSVIADVPGWDISDVARRLDNLDVSAALALPWLPLPVDKLFLLLSLVAVFLVLLRCLYLSTH